MTKQPIITVVGSINMDMVTVTDQVPVQGETLIGERFETIPGGKGANQAVAAARLGGNVQFIGRVGDDAFGKELQQVLQQEGISVTNVEPVTHSSSGVATILLSENDNRIIVIPGANRHVTPEYVERHKEQLLASDLVLLQFEIPLETIRYCLDLCEQAGIPAIVNPAPAQNLGEDYWKKALYITPNETEEKELDLDQNQEIAQKLIVTMGERGAKFTENGEEKLVPSYKVEPTDTTGAGDTFNGALAVAISENMSLQQAVEFANAAAALSVQRFGAQGGMPTRDELEQFIRKSREQS
ncbi:ribokinase [Halalkalibacter krulwichiae]|uniref:Ribokinase n=1 Tax=Halalkalibacter krulwichiae TaxID=199441 RepID=A0A1X9MGN0_9BACI|nr:ribokinase [Halalkalibacter krulwichiae]ARK32617.1 Ribokinase [Halalkalibacter krulwichiae]